MFKIEIPYIAIELCNALLNVCIWGEKGRYLKVTHMVWTMPILHGPWFSHLSGTERISDREGEKLLI